MTLKCSTCKKDKQSFEFRKGAHWSRGYSYSCIECLREYSRTYYKKNPDKIRKAPNVQEKQSYLCWYLENHPCTDCGETDIVVLEFDHIRGEKKGEITTMSFNGSSLDRIKEEIEKCEVVCCNCHKRRTVSRYGSYYKYEYLFSVVKP